MATDKSYTIEVEGVGSFRFRARVMADRHRIPAAAVNMLGGSASHPYLFDQALRHAEIQVLMVSGPEGWTIDSLDPLDADDVAQVEKVSEAFRAAEDTFRAGAKAKRP